MMPGSGIMLKLLLTIQRQAVSCMTSCIGYTCTMVLMAAKNMSRLAHLFEQLPELVKGCIKAQHVANSHNDFFLGRHTLELLQAACSSLQYALVAGNQCQGTSSDLYQLNLLIFKDWQWAPCQAIVQGLE